MEILKKVFYPTASFVFIFGLWEILSRLGVFANNIMPAPSEIWVALKDVARSGVLAQNAWASLYRVFAGFLIATTLAIPMGLIIGSKKYLHTTFNPLIQIIRTISPISWIPLAILWFGIGNQPAIFIIFITAFFPILLSTMLAVKNVDPILIKVAENFGATGNKLLFKIILPAIFPYIIIGLRVSLGIAWVIVVAAEMVGMTSGLGYMILDARNFLRTDLIIAGMLVIGLIGFALDSMLEYFEKRAKAAWGLKQQ
ncbi:MAG: hypothetical protein A3J93_04915 [Candidatus Magasanikbacteria bacterium RIFOXYC2_FULL_42_28]|uniref:ABC transmembrane type-1 domain-containing protein n=1 Tax=Candidatus Magasanikbacteria bacterium RIFOXYC2_FULL_42_28 TaxID=1798704 RepID=A0A1F6NWR0_9BACT|nr:MAG: hypothetical protein A3J93_04915 [Candidatus Magasanikbacteria bacterium RIFOXYC2_FULL_42_28]